MRIQSSLVPGLPRFYPSSCVQYNTVSNHSCVLSYMQTEEQERGYVQRESKQEEIMCRKCAVHTKVFGEDGLVVFLLQCRKSRVQNHLTLLRQVQQYLYGDNEWLPW